MWQNKTRPNKTARVPYAYIASEEDPLDHLDEGHSCRRVAAWLVEKMAKRNLTKR